MQDLEINTAGVALALDLLASDRRARVASAALTVAGHTPLIPARSLCMRTLLLALLVADRGLSRQRLRDDESERCQR